MFDHLSLTVRNLDRARPFYRAVMEALGHAQVRDEAGAIGFGTRRNADTDVPAYISIVADAEFLPGTGHVAFEAASRDIVHRFHAAALAHGGSDDGAPGPRPDYHSDYYAAFVRDPEGNRLEAVCHKRVETA